MPLAIRAPARYLGGTRPSTTVTETTANVDLAPTILDFAGAEPCSRERCRTLDGRSLKPLIEGKANAWPRDRGILLESGKAVTMCSYRGIRTSNEVYIEHREIFDPDTRQCIEREDFELYDLTEDPWQLDNRLFTETAANEVDRARLQARLHSLERCVGTQGNGQAPPCE